MENSITDLRKWNLVAGGSDPRNDVIPASVGYGLEEALQFAMSEITRLEDRCKRLQDAGDASECSKLKRELNAANAEIEEKRKDVVWLATEKAKLENYVMLLEEAGDAMERYCDAISAENWRKAKEDKP